MSERENLSQLLPERIEKANPHRKLNTEEAKSLSMLEAIAEKLKHGQNVPPLHTTAPWKAFKKARITMISINGGGDRIRTYVGFPRRSYSPLHLTALPPLLEPKI